MKDYVLREDVLRCIEEAGHDNELDLGYPGHNEAFQEIIKNISAADVVEVRHGRWIFDFALDGSNFYRCSECGRQECLLAKYSIYEFAPYCHCGAKMTEV